MGYTFYGDILGMSNYYKLDKNIAYKKLNDFYNTTFYTLEGYCIKRGKVVQVEMYSDSLVIWGNESEKILEELSKVYLELFQKGLMLRGALVKGKLEIEPRLTLDNFKKNLPKDDNLARAVGLANSYKGSRLLIENDLAMTLLSSCRDWLTQEGYLRNIIPTIPLNNILRKICPTPDNSAYELLYFWSNSDFSNISNRGYLTDLREIDQLSEMFSKEIAAHYKETSFLLKRCRSRHKYTNSLMCGHTSDLKNDM